MWNEDRGSRIEDSRSKIVKTGLGFAIYTGLFLKLFGRGGSIEDRIVRNAFFNDRFSVLDLRISQEARCTTQQL